MNYPHRDELWVGGDKPAPSTDAQGPRGFQNDPHGTQSWWQQRTDDVSTRAGITDLPVTSKQSWKEQRAWTVRD